ncbi:RIP metalloprotease RseP [bacterium]|nr:MAG: RIP metalloprotease RseP [bacterium]
MIAFFIFLLILGVLIIVHEFGHFITAKRLGVRVNSFSLGFGPQIFKKRIKDTEYSVSAIPLGGYVELAGDNLESYTGKKDEYLTQSIGRRFQIIFFGPLLNYALAFLFFWLIFFAGYPTLTTDVGSLVDGLGAKDAGVQVGDKIIAVDGEAVDYWEDLQRVIHTKKAASLVRLTILRKEKEETLKVKIQEKQFDDIFGEKQKIGLLGVTPSGEIVKIRHGFFDSFLLSAAKTWELTALTYKALGMMITGKLSLRDSVTGPLGMFYITSKVSRLGIIAIVHLMAILSLNLAIFNLLPLPVLDGGHIFLLGIEKIRGKYLSLKTERIIAKVGFTIIIALALLVTFNDLLKFGDRILNFFNR